MLNETLLSARSSTTPHGNVLHEFVSEPRLIAKHEKKYEWTKQGIMNLFDSLNGIKTYQSLLDEPGCKFWINEVGTIQSVILISLSSNAERVPIFQVLLIVQDRVLV